MKFRPLLIFKVFKYFFIIKMGTIRSISDWLNNIHYTDTPARVSDKINIQLILSQKLFFRHQ